MMKKGKKAKKKRSGGFLRKRAMSFRNAFSGISLLIKYEHNAWIHLTVMALVIAAGILLGISPAEWLVIVLAAGLVLVCETINTSLEYLSDEVNSRFSRNIKRAKDVAAAAVLISAIVSAAVGLIVFLPRVFRLFS